MRTWQRSAANVYAATAHELAHWAHCVLDHRAFENLVYDAYILDNTLFNFDNSEEAVIESWASGVEWQFAQERYENQFDMIGYEYDHNGYQDLRIHPFNEDNNDLIYTSIVIDLMDDCNQRTNTCYSTVWIPRFIEFPEDQVEGYTISEIEEGLNGAQSWNQWRDNIRNINNSTSGNVNQLFANWY